jgi:Tol biopolymer transport system component
VNIKYHIAITIISLTILTFSLAQINTINESDFPVLEGLYLGQTPPGMTPEIYAPGIVSTGHYEQSNLFSPDGKAFYYTLVGPKYGIILFMKMHHGKWSSPQTAPFSGKYNDYYPFYSPDGKRLYFVSMRPVSGQGEPRKDFDIWFVESIENYWSEPQNIGFPINNESYDLHPTVTNDGTLYFVSSRKGGKGRMDIYRSRLVDGHYLIPENLGNSINTEFAESNPYIAPDESYLIFTSHGRSDGYGKYDLYISFRRTDGSWTKAKNMGNKMNSKDNESTPNLSHDGKYFFFTSARNSYDSYSELMYTYDNIKKMLNSPGNGKGDIYWVDAKIIEDLKPDELTIGE